MKMTFIEWLVFVSVKNYMTKNIKSSVSKLYYDYYIHPNINETPKSLHV